MQTVDDVLNAVSVTFGYSVDDLLGDSRSKPIVMARQTAMFVCRAFLNMSYPEIGKALGRDHSTVMHGCKKIEDFLKTHPDVESHLNTAIGKASKKAKGPLTKIHVNQHVIKANAKNGTSEPPLTVKQGKTNTYGKRVEILDSDGNVVAAVVYHPDDPLSCGARVWIETRNEVLIHDDV